MNKLGVLLVLLIAALAISPLMFPSCSSNEEEDGDGSSFDFDYDYDGKHRKSRSARSLGGSHSYSIGK